MNICYLLSSWVLCLFSSSKTSRESSFFGGSDIDQSSIHKPVDATIPDGQSNAVTTTPSSIMKAATPVRLQTLRVWLRDSQLRPMDDIKVRGLGDVVCEAIPLEDPIYQRVSSDCSGYPKPAIPVDLAVLDLGIPRVLSEYGTVDFFPLSDKDPIILAQEPDDIESKKALAYQKIYARYLWQYKKRWKLAKVLGYELHEVTKAWFEERLRVIGDYIQRLGYY